MFRTTRIPLFLRSKLSAFQLSIFLKRTGQHLYAIYEPIILYYILNQNISYVLIYYGICGVSDGLSVYPYTRLLSPYSVKIKLIIGTLAFVASLIALSILTTFDTTLAQEPGVVIMWLVIYALLFSCYKAAYWPAYHTHLSVTIDHAKRGSAVGFLQLLEAAAAIFAPLLGAVLLVFTNSTALLGVALLTIALSSIPLSFIPSHFSQLIFSWTGFIKEIFNPKHLRSYLPFFGEAHTYLGIFWVLYVYTSVESVVGLGAIVVGVTLISGLIGFVLGKFVDRSERVSKGMLRVGVTISVLGWLLKGLFTNPYALFVTDNIQKIGFSIHDLPYMSNVYKRYQQLPNMSDEYIIVRETIIHSIGGILLLTLGLILLTGGDTYWGFLFGAIGSLGYLFI